MAQTRNQVIGLFPTPIMHVPGALAPETRDRLVERIRAEQKSVNVHDSRLSHTSMVHADSDPLFAEAAGRIARPLAEFGEHLMGQALDWRVKEIWVNVLERGGHQALHNHANSFVSGIVYLTPFHPSSGTVFHKALGGSDFAFVNQNKDSRTGPFNARRWQAPKMAPGDMILFPSYMLHEVPRNEGDQRITMAFNALPTRIDSWGYAVDFS